MRILKNDPGYDKIEAERSARGMIFSAKILGALAVLLLVPATFAGAKGLGVIGTPLLFLSGVQWLRARATQYKYRE
jgi:hypothetical protein